MNNHQADIIIVGGGIVGSALACALAELPLSITLIDGKINKSTTIDELLVSAITYDCQQWLEKIGAWSLIDKNKIGVFRTMEVWEEENNKPTKIKFDSAYLGIPTLGYIVNNHSLQQALNKKLAKYSNVTILQPCQPTKININENQVTLTANEMELSAKLLIGADGANSWVRKHCEFPLTEKSYEHSALITTLQIEHPHHQCAYQRFYGNSILGILPLQNPYQSSLVWSGPPDDMNALQHFSDEKFTQAINDALSHYLGKIKITTSRATIPLTMRHVKHYVKNRVALIGDAAHTIHPLAGQGLNLGLWDAEELINCISKTISKNRDIGLYQNLRPFERARYTHNQLMLSIVSANKWLFTNPNKSLCHLRRTGMQLVQHMSFVKNKIMQTAVFGS